MHKRLLLLITLLVVILSVFALFLGCAGPAGNQGPAGAPGAPGPAGSPGPVGASTGAISGTVTNSLTNSPVSGVAITTDPAVQGVSITTQADGTYSANLPIGAYTFSFKKDGFTAATQPASLAAAQKTTKNVALVPAKPVAISLGTALTAQPGGSVSLKAAVTPLDGSTIKSYQWTQVNGTKANIDGAATDTVKVALANAAAFKAELIKGIVMEDRWTVQGVSPHALSAAEVATFKVAVTTSSGTYSGTQTVTVDLPYSVSPGIADVPVAVPVLLHGKKQASYKWTLTGPSGSKAALDSAADQNPVFTPDVVGKYTIADASGGTITVYAGTWEGAISGIAPDGKPLAANCTGCHNDKVAADNFKDWRNSGHAAIFTKNLNNPAGHWAESCASCHTVGYDNTAKNNGWDEAMTAESWKVPSHGDVGLWNTIVAKFPKTAQLANIQCENCHGPNNGTGLHPDGKINAERVSLSAEACGSCHGEPPRHGRFQQWEESGHANFELAIDDATVEARGATAAHCGRCHTAQGYLTWIKGDLTKQIQGAKGNATVDELRAMGLTKSTVQPQTCVVCHDPHDPGSQSGEPNKAKVRFMKDTPMLPAGFAATNVGMGATCMTCHNTRNGVRNDAVPPPSYSAPHTAAQADVLMGQNAYFVAVGERSSHSYIENTCSTCHLRATPPPAEFSFNRAGTNHAFKASLEICGDCHTKELSGEAFKSGGEERLHVLAVRMSSYMMGKLPASFAVKDYTPHQYNNKNYDIKSDLLALEKTNIASIEPVEPHGQQGFLIKFKNPVTVTYAPANESKHTVSVKEVEVQLGDVTTADGKAAIIGLADPLVKVGWNYFLLHGDGSGGIHNPSFVKSVIQSSIDALK